MRRHLHVERLGGVRGLQPRRDAADPGDVDLDDPGRARRQVLREAGRAVERLADRDGDGRGRGQPDVPRQVVRRQRLLEPGQVVRLVGVRPADRLGGGHRLVRVHHQHPVRSDRLPDGREPRGVLARGGPADLHLGAAQPLRLGPAGARRQFVRGQVQPAALGVVDRQPRVRAPRQPPQRLAGPAAAQVPQRGVDGGQRERGDRPDRGGPGGRQQSPPQRLDVARVLADQQRGEVVAQQGQHRTAAGADRVRVAGARQPVVGGEGDQHRLLADERLLGVGAQRLRLQEDHAGLDAGDRAHGVRACRSAGCGRVVRGRGRAARRGSGRWRAPTRRGSVPGTAWRGLTWWARTGAGRRPRPRRAPTPRRAAVAPRGRSRRRRRTRGRRRSAGSGPRRGRRRPRPRRR